MIVGFVSIIINYGFSFLNKPIKKPSEKSAGKVLRPKINITKAPQTGLPVLAAVIANT